jgi:hypothetical protein
MFFSSFFITILFYSNFVYFDLKLFAIASELYYSAPIPAPPPLLPPFESSY